MTNHASHLKAYEYVMANIDQIAINQKQIQDDHCLKQVSFGAFEALSDYFKSNNNPAMAHLMTRLAQRMRNLNQEPPEQQNLMMKLGRYVRNEVMKEHDHSEAITKDEACEIFAKHMDELDVALGAFIKQDLQEREDANVSGELSDEMKQRMQDYIDKAQEAQKN